MTTPSTTNLAKASNGKRGDDATAFSSLNMSPILNPTSSTDSMSSTNSKRNPMPTMSLGGYSAAPDLSKSSFTPIRTSYTIIGTNGVNEQSTRPITSSKKTGAKQKTSGDSSPGAAKHNQEAIEPVGNPSNRHRHHEKHHHHRHHHHHHHHHSSHHLEYGGGAVQEEEVTALGLSKENESPTDRPSSKSNTVQSKGESLTSPLYRGHNQLDNIEHKVTKTSVNNTDIHHELEATYTNTQRRRSERMIHFPSVHVTKSDQAEQAPQTNHQKPEAPSNQSKNSAEGLVLPDINQTNAKDNHNGLHNHHHNHRHQHNNHHDVRLLNHDNSNAHNHAHHQPPSRPDANERPAADVAASTGMRKPASLPNVTIGAVDSLIEQDRRLKFEDLDFKNLIGTGSFAQVYLVQSKQTKDYFAMKKMSKARMIEKKQQNHIQNEKNILMHARGHPFIVHLHWTYQQTQHLYMLMEFVAGGEMFTLLHRVKRFDRKASVFYSAEILCALEFLHSHQIAYRDLKPENMLIDKEGHLKLGDFGFAKRITDRTFTLCGTPEYIAPEVIEKKGHNTMCDFWTLGINVFEFLSGTPPFYDSNESAIYDRVLSMKIPWPSYFDNTSKDFIKRLLISDPAKRLGSGNCKVLDSKTLDRLTEESKNDWTMPPISSSTTILKLASSLVPPPTNLASSSPNQRNYAEPSQVVDSGFFLTEPEEDETKNNTERNDASSLENTMTSETITITHLNLNSSALAKTPIAMSRGASVLTNLTDITPDTTIGSNYGNKLANTTYPFMSSDTFSSLSINNKKYSVPPEKKFKISAGLEEIKQHRWFISIKDWSDVFYRRLEPPYKPTLFHEGDTQNFKCDNIPVAKEPTLADDKTNYFNDF